MNAKAFNQLLESRLIKTRLTLAAKGKEYSSDDDRLHNFKVAALEFSEAEPDQALWGMLKKHLVSVRDLCYHERPLSLSQINEKIGDAINYLCLLEALWVERLNNEKGYPTDDPAQEDGTNA